MLPLMRINTDQLRLVCTSDPSVMSAASEGAAEGEDAPATWINADTATLDAEALILTVRALRSSEVLRFQGSVDGHIALYAAKLCTVSAKGPGISTKERSEVEDLLDRLRPSDLAALGAKIVELSLLPADPTEAPGSER